MRGQRLPSWEEVSEPGQAPGEEEGVGPSCTSSVWAPAAKASPGETSESSDGAPANSAPTAHALPSAWGEAWQEPLR